MKDDIPEFPEKIINEGYIEKKSTRRCNTMFNSFIKLIPFGIVLWLAKRIGRVESKSCIVRPVLKDVAIVLKEDNEIK